MRDDDVALPITQLLSWLHEPSVEPSSTTVLLRQVAPIDRQNAVDQLRERSLFVIDGNDNRKLHTAGRSKTSSENTAKSPPSPNSYEDLLHYELAFQGATQLVDIMLRIGGSGNAIKTARQRVEAVFGAAGEE